MASNFPVESIDVGGKRRAAMVTHYARYRDFVTDALPALRHGGSWSGESNRDTRSKALDGDESLVPQAEALIERLNARIERPQAVFLPEAMGAYPIVPEALQGVPDCMRRRHDVATDRAPVTVWICTTSSGGVSTEGLRMRGTACLALVLQLTAIRPVTLRVYSELGTWGNGASFVSVPIECQPIDLARACYALTSGGWARNLSYSWQVENHGANGNWGWGDDFTVLERPERVAAVRKALGAGERDVIVPPVTIDWNERNAAEWLQKRLDELAAAEAAEQE